MSDEAKVKVKDESNDHIYFTVTPRLVWALASDPDEYTFWCVVKDIAGEKGECILARDDLAALAMISGGKASQCRESLIDKKLLIGEFRRDPGYPQAVWHLSIPDFWEANTRWARKYISLRDRVDYKKQQLAALKEFRKASQADGSQDASQADKGMSPGDGGISPGDTKKNVLKNHKEESINTKDSCLDILQDVAVSIFPEYATWHNLKRQLQNNDIAITGDRQKMTISGLSEKIGNFTKAQIWADKYSPYFSKFGLELTFTE